MAENLMDVEEYWEIICPECHRWMWTDAEECECGWKNTTIQNDKVN